MWNEDTVAGAMRDAIRRQLPPGAGLLRDRRDALYITDGEIDDAEGFFILRRGSLRAIIPDDKWILDLERIAPPRDYFSNSLQRFIGMEPTDEARSLFIRGIKLLDGGATDAEITLFDRAVRNLSAIALRRGNGGGTYAAAILNCQLLNRRRKI